MYSSLINLLKEVSFFVGYVKSFNYEDKLTKEDERKYILLSETKT